MEIKLYGLRRNVFGLFFAAGEWLQTSQFWEVWLLTAEFAFLTPPKIGRFQKVAFKFLSTSSTQKSYVINIVSTRSTC